MSDSPSSLSDDALSKLLVKSSATIRAVGQPSEKVLDRLKRFNQLFSSLRTPPEGTGLIYQESGSELVQFHPLAQTLVVGRSRKSAQNPDACELAFETRTELSRRHFEVTLTDGLCILRDLESLNGTYVNGEPQRIKECVLKVGDVISAGGVIFAFAAG
jgi:pSer/pThr/pTyr-binding forkhead associated (FHA) protein